MGLGLDDTRPGNQKKFSGSDLDGADLKGSLHKRDSTILRAQPNRQLDRRGYASFTECRLERMNNRLIVIN
jgi:hypothetical protein